MKLGEFEIDDQDDKAEDIGLFVLNRIPVGVTKVRVEIHSLDNPPWPTERPEGWGVGCWCRFMDTRECGRKVELQGIVYNKYISLPGVAYQVVLPVPVDGPQLRNVGVESITAFGPRAEVPG